MCAQNARGSKEGLCYHTALDQLRLACEISRVEWADGLAPLFAAALISKPVIRPSTTHRPRRSRAGRGARAAHSAAHALVQGVGLTGGEAGLFFVCGPRTRLPARGLTRGTTLPGARVERNCTPYGETLVVWLVGRACSCSLVVGIISGAVVPLSCFWYMLTSYYHLRWYGL